MSKKLKSIADKQWAGAPTSRLFASLQATRPVDARAARRLGLPVGRIIGAGSYRSTHLLEGFPDLVIKFPETKLDPDVHDFAYDSDEPQLKTPEGHVEAEMSNIEIINTRPEYASLRRHIPTIYFYDPASHIQVSKRCRPTPRGSYKSTHIITDLFKSVLKIEDSDFAFQNIMLDENDRLIVVDLGYVRLDPR